MTTPAPSGLSAVDARWGGLRVGGAYLLVGRADVGRAGLALQIARAAVDDGGRCLIISPRSPEALAADGRAVGLDLGEAHRTGRLRLLRTPDAAALAERGSEGLTRAYSDLATLVQTDRPDRVVIEDLTPLVQFDSFEALDAAFSGLVAALEAVDATLVVGLGEPANEASAHLLELLGQHVDGSIRLHTENSQRRLVLYRHREPETSTAPDPTPEAPAASAETPTAEPPPVLPQPSGADPAPDAVPLPDSEPAANEPAAPGLYAASTGDGSPAPPPPSPDGAPPRTAVVPPPPAEAALLEATDAFGYDTAEAFVRQGYMIDSAGASTAAPTAPSPPAATPVTPFAGAVQQAFAARDSGGHFLVLAVRMEPSAPESAHFAIVANGLRSALRPQDVVAVDAQALRAAVLLPDGSPEASQALFAGLQAHLRATLPEQGEAVLRAVGAVSIPDGQPFTTSEELLAYVFEG